MSSGKKFSECVYCIHYKSPVTDAPCNTCKEETPFTPASQFKTFTELMATGTKEEYESIRNVLREYYGKPISKEEK